MSLLDQFEIAWKQAETQKIYFWEENQRNFVKILQVFQGKMGFQLKSELFPGLTGVNWSQYATYFHLDPI